MSVVRPIPPQDLRSGLEANGYRVIDETEHNWLLARDTGVPIAVPKHGRRVSLDAMQGAYHHDPRAVLDAVQRSAASGASATNPDAVADDESADD